MDTIVTLVARELLLAWDDWSYSETQDVCVSRVAEIAVAAVLRAQQEDNPS